MQLAEVLLPTGEYEYDGQPRHVDKAVAPTVVEYFLAAHSAHTAVPRASLYFPATQRIHQGFQEYVAAPSGPVDPALQVQPDLAVLPAGEYEYKLQEIQLDSDWSPVLEEYFAAGQLSQTGGTQVIPTYAPPPT